MAEIRQGYLDDYTQIASGNIGIGTSSASDAKLEIIGGTTSQEFNVTGIATFGSVSGFIKKHTDYTEDVNITNGDSATLSGEIVVGAGVTMTVGTGVTSSQGSLHAMKVLKMFQPPSGTTNTRPSGKPGALFYNFDFKTIEFFDGNNWRQVINTTAAGRAVLLGGNRNPASAATTALGAFNIPSGGKESIFGDLLGGASNAGSGVGDRTRGVYTASTSNPNTLTYVTIPSLGDSIEFGDLLSFAYRHGGASSSDTRGVIFGGRGAPGSCHNIIQYLQIQTLGNALDFGDLQVTGRGQGANINSPIRGFSVGNCPYTEEIQFVNISTTGNAIIFGDQIFGGGYQGGTSNSVRGVLNGGYMQDGVTISNQKSFITMASEGNAQEFGDLTEGLSGGLSYSYNGATQVRGTCMGGLDNASSPYPSRTTVDAYNFESQGEITEIGDLSEGKRDGGMTTDSHGGLGGY